MLFENHSVPSMYIGKSAALSCTAAGKSTGIVVDSGGMLSFARDRFETITSLRLFLTRRALIVPCSAQPESPLQWPSLMGWWWPKVS